MKNYIQKGDAITVPAPATVASGSGVLVGALFGVANGDAESGADVVLSTVGVFTLPCPTADDIATGGLLYWDAAESKATSDDAEGANAKIGVAIAAAGVGVTSVKARLNGAF